MFYATPFFQRFYPSVIHINDQQLLDVKNADVIAVDFYNHYFDEYSVLVNILLNNSKKLFLYIGEPTDQQPFINFLHQFDLPNVHFYADCVLNFKLTSANFTPTINWFIDPINYYTEYFWAKQLLTELQFDCVKPYYFDILLGLEKPHRTFLSSLVNSSQYKDQFIYSYFKENLSNGTMWDKNINVNSHTLTSELFQINGEDARPSAIIPVDIYNQSYYSIVCETTAYNSYNQYTEKVAKPILAKRPFVVFAGQHYLKNLKSLGFKTFDSIIDESYDLESNLNLRFLSAWRQVEHLCKLNPAEVFAQVNPILEYNQQHFLTTDWADPIKNLF